MEDTTTTTSRSSSSSNIPTQRQTLWQWMVMCGKNISSSKEDKFIWHPLSSYYRNSREEILYTPNNIDDQWVEDVLSKSRIRGRKEWIDFILSPSYNSHDDEQQQQKNLKEETLSPLLQKQISIIETCYKERRMEVRNLSNIYIANSRHRHQNDFFPPEPIVVGDMDQQQGQSTVQIDRHGRLVRSRQDGSNHDDNDDDDNGDNNEIVELVDAADTFWKKHKQKQTLNGRGVSVSTSSSTASLDVSQRNIPLQQQQPPQVPPPPLLPNPLNEQQIRERNISQQMENESRQAITRAIHRYRRQQQEQEGDEAIFELVHIPLMPQRNDVNVPRWLRFLSLNRQQRQGQQQDLEGDNIPHQQQQQNHHPNELQHQQQQQRNQHHNHNGENWIDLRLALRRICFAVITVVAAFICMMLQGLPTYVDFGDDEYYGMMDMDTIFLSGLLGPYAHYPGQHHRQQQQQQQQSRNEWTYHDIVLGEDGESDIQQSIWNRLLSEDAVFDQGHHDDNGSGEEL